MRNKVIARLLLFLVLVGCAGEKHLFHIEGTVEEINLKDACIYVDGFWLPVKNAETYHVGDVVFAEVESKAEGDQYDPEKITVNKIEIREPSNR